MAVAGSTESAAASRPLSAADWVRAAMTAIVEGGIAGVAVEPLAVRLGATKGSFYHHFANRDALIAAALEDWERAQTEAVIERLELIADPAARLRAVTAAALADRAGGVRDAALLASASHPLVGPVVERVTARRLRYLTDMYVALGLSRPRAGRRALLLYSSYLGLFGYLRAGLGGDQDERERRAYADELLSVLIPGEPAPPRPRRP
jgi:AcrR family transcriptional regulator